MSADCYFRDRSDAGQALAQALSHLSGDDSLVLGLARGGVIVGAAVAQTIGCPLDVIVVRKVGALFQPEYGIGAVAPGGVRVYDAAALSSMGFTEEEFFRLAEREEVEIERRLAAYRDGYEAPSVKDRIAVLVDDGLATGVTAVAAVRYARTLGARRVVMAAPVCSRQGKNLLEEEADEVVCACTPEQFFAVGQWYSDFTQTTDAQVIEALQRLRDGGYVS